MAHVIKTVRKQTRKIRIVGVRKAVKGGGIAAALSKQASAAMKNCLTAGLSSLSEDDRRRIYYFCEFDGTFSFMFRKVEDSYEPVIKLGFPKRVPSLTPPREKKCRKMVSSRRRKA